MTPWLEPDGARAVKLTRMIRLVDVTFVAIDGHHVTPCEGALGYDQSQVSVLWRRERNVVAAVFPYEFSLHATPKDGEKTQIALIRVALRVEYSLSEDFTDEHAEDLPHCVGVAGFMHTWPYLRAEVQALTTKLGLPALTLPLVVSGHAQKAVRVAQAESVAQAGSMEAQSLDEQLAPAKELISKNDD